MDKGKTLAVLPTEKPNNPAVLRSDSMDLNHYSYISFHVDKMETVYINTSHTILLGDKRAEVGWVMKYSEVLVTLPESPLSPSTNNGTA